MDKLMPKKFILFCFYLEGAKLKKVFPWLDKILETYAFKYIKIDENCYVFPVDTSFQEFTDIQSRCREQGFEFCSVEFDSPLSGCFLHGVEGKLKKEGVQVRNIARIGNS